MAVAAPVPPPAQPEEVRYPDREFTLGRMTTKEKNSGAIGFRFVHDFRQSCFHFSFGLSQQREKILVPPRSQLIHHIQDFSPNYQFPNCLSNKDLTIETKRKVVDDGQDVIKYEWKKQTIVGDDDMEEDQDDKEQGSDDEQNQPEEENDEDLIGEYNIVQYEDHETGEDNGSDDGSGEDD